MMEKLQTKSNVRFMRIPLETTSLGEILHRCSFVDFENQLAVSLEGSC